MEKTNGMRLVTRTMVGLYLAFTRLCNPLYHSLSLNITREVFSYIAPDQLLVGFRDRCLVVYVVPREATMTTCTLDLDLSGRGIVLLSDTIALLVGNCMSENFARTVNIWTGQIHREAAMLQGRSNPGVLKYQQNVWVFGGCDQLTPLRSVESFHLIKRRWSPALSMFFPRAYFTPCEYQGWIYLADACRRKKQIEVFHPVQMFYKLLPLELHSEAVQSVSFVYDQHLIFINYKQSGQWHLNSNDKGLQGFGSYPSDPSLCYTSGISVSQEGAVYWISEGSELVKFDIKSKELKRCVCSELTR